MACRSCLEGAKHCVIISQGKYLLMKCIVCPMWKEYDMMKRANMLCSITQNTFSKNPLLFLFTGKNTFRYKLKCTNTLNVAYNSYVHTIDQDTKHFQYTLQVLFPIQINRSPQRRSYFLFNMWFIFLFYNYLKLHFYTLCSLMNGCLQETSSSEMQSWDLCTYFFFFPSLFILL